MIESFNFWIGSHADWLSGPGLLWAGTVLLGIATLFAKGFLKKLGEDCYAWIKRKLFRGPPEPARVANTFVPTSYAPEDCYWVREEKLFKYDDEGYTYYPHPKTRGRTYRLVLHANTQTREFLVVRPGATRLK
jgi:hypothetical protein